MTFSLLVFFLVFRGNRLISIRWKLGLLFLYANGLPLLILALSAMNICSKTGQILLDHAYEQVSGLLTDFDARFDTIKLETAASLNKVVDQINSTYQDKMPPKTALDVLFKESVW